MVDYALLEIAIKPYYDEESYQIEPRLLLPGQDEELRPPGDAPILAHFDLDALGRQAAYDDRYGRLLRYVFVDGMLVNAQLVKEGLANVYMESGLKYEDELHEAEYYAKLNALGIWEKDVAYADYIYIVKFHYDAAGNDHENLNDEYVVLGNKGDIPIDMTEWTIKDEVNHIFTFPNFVLGPGEEVAIHTGSGVNTEDSLFWNNQGAVWNNKGDSLYLRNSAGELIFSYEY